jgi:hypothetical protein
MEKEEWKPFRNALGKSDRKKFDESGTFRGCTSQHALIQFSLYHFIQSLYPYCSPLQAANRTEAQVEQTSTRMEDLQKVQLQQQQQPNLFDFLY